MLRDRKTLSSEGIVVTMLPIDNTGKLTGRPKLLSRGFVYEKLGQDLFDEAVRIVEKKLKPGNGQIADLNKVRRDAVADLEEYFYKSTGRRPLILVEVIQI